MPSTDLITGQFEPLEITVGFANVPEAAHEHERRLRFKQSLRSDMLAKVGPIPNSSWMPSNPPSTWDDVTEENARGYLTEFILSNHPGSLFHPGNPAGTVCRMTSKGWIKEYTFPLFDSLNRPVTCEDTTELYKKLLKPGVPDDVLGPQAASELRGMEVLVSIRFSIREDQMRRFQPA